MKQLHVWKVLMVYKCAWFVPPKLDKICFNWTRICRVRTARSDVLPACARVRVHRRRPELEPAPSQPLPCPAAVLLTASSMSHKFM